MEENFGRDTAAEGRRGDEEKKRLAEFDPVVLAAAAASVAKAIVKEAKCKPVDGLEEERDRRSIKKSAWVQRNAVVNEEVARSESEGEEEPVATREVSEVAAAPGVPERGTNMQRLGASPRRVAAQEQAAAAGVVRPLEDGAEGPPTGRPSALVARPFEGEADGQPAGRPRALNGHTRRRFRF